MVASTVTSHPQLRFAFTNSICLINILAVALIRFTHREFLFCFCSVAQRSDVAAVSNLRHVHSDARRLHDAEQSAVAKSESARARPDAEPVQRCRSTHEQGRHLCSSRQYPVTDSLLLSCALQSYSPKPVTGAKQQANSSKEYRSVTQISDVKTVNNVNVARTLLSDVTLKILTRTLLR